MDIILQINLGGFSNDFHGPSYGAAFEQLGHSVIYVDHNHPIPDRGFDMMFHSYHSIDNSVIDELKSRGTTTCLALCDEPCEFFRTSKFSFLYDIVFNQTGGWDNIEMHRGLGANMYPLPHCADTNKYHPVEVTNEEREFYGSDIAFIGSFKTPKIRNDRLWMHDIFKGYNFKSWGPGTMNDRWIYPDEVNKIYASSKIIFNPSAVADQPDWNVEYPMLLAETACRVYNTAAARAFQIAPRRDWTRCISKPFDDDEVAYYNMNDIDDLYNTIDRYLNDGDRRSQMAAKSYIRCINEHTYVHRARVVIDYVERYRSGI